MKKFLSVALCALLCIGAAALPVGFSACGNDNVLVIGYTQYAPMNYFENGILTGHDTELATKVLHDELGYDIEFQEIKWEAKIIELNSGRIDLIWNGMTITDELKESILITDPYMVNKQVLVTRAEDAGNYTAIADLAKADSIAYESGSAADTLISELSLTGVKLNSMDAQSNALLEVKAGTSDVAVIDITMAMSMTGEGTDYANLTYKDIGFAEEQYGVGLRKSDTELCKKINEVFAEFEENGTMDMLYQKYMVKE